LIIGLGADLARPLIDPLRGGPELLLGDLAKPHGGKAELLDPGRGVRQRDQVPGSAIELG
jgi:hypothetical protein